MSFYLKSQGKPLANVKPPTCKILTHHKYSPFSLCSCLHWSFVHPEPDTHQANKSCNFNKFYIYIINFINLKGNIYEVRSHDIKTVKSESDIFLNKDLFGIRVLGNREDVRLKTKLYASQWNAGEPGWIPQNLSWILVPNRQGIPCSTHIF